MVAKGYTQTYGIDYQETFAPVANMNSIKVLLSVATNKKWPLWQLDVKHAFLHDHLHEKVCMMLPPGFKLSRSEGKLCRLKKALYGLKQSPRAWFERFSSNLKKVGYKQSQVDHTMFVKHTKRGTTVVIVYVDDIVVTGNDHVEEKQFKSHLSNEFEVKDLGALRNS